MYVLSGVYLQVSCAAAPSFFVYFFEEKVSNWSILSSEGLSFGPECSQNAWLAHQHDFSHGERERLQVGIHDIPHDCIRSYIVWQTFKERGKVKIKSHALRPLWHICETFSTWDSATFGAEISCDISKATSSKKRSQEDFLVREMNFKFEAFWAKEGKEIFSRLAHNDRDIYFLIALLTLKDCTWF